VTADQAIALQAFTLLKNGMGGLDWAGLPFVVAHLGVQDVPALIEALHTIKTYSPPKDED
jgi:hypothetical protein